MLFEDWAADWSVPPAAVADYLKRVREAYAADAAPRPDTPVTENDATNLVRLEASVKGGILWRNNVGGCYDENGRFIRYGLANESKRINDKFKSSDLIGIMPRPITPAMVGRTIGQFVAREMKRSDWRFTGTARERAQLQFVETVNALGGDAAFCIGEGTL